MSWVGIVFVLAVEVTVVSVASNLPSTSEREGLGAAGAALGFSGVQRRWRLEKTRKARLKTPQCAHMGTLEPRVGR